MKQILPFEQFFNLGRLSQTEQTVMLAPDSAQRDQIAVWAGVEAVKSLTAKIDLRKQSASQFLVNFELRAEISQNCVVTLEPVNSLVSKDFNRLLSFSCARSPIKLRLSPVAHPAVLDLSEEEGPEEIGSLCYDLAGPVLEELVLAIDPYPRKAIFQPPAEPEERDDPAAQSPFAILKSLKSRS
jgi:hypothetical protein